MQWELRRVSDNHLLRTSDQFESSSKEDPVDSDFSPNWDVRSTPIDPRDATFTNLSVKSHDPNV